MYGCSVKYSFTLKPFLYVFLSHCVNLPFRQLKEHEKVKNSEAEELLVRMSALEAERKILLMDKANLSTSMKHIETELQLSQQTNRYIRMHAHKHENIQKTYFMRVVIVSLFILYSRWGSYPGGFFEIMTI